MTDRRSDILGASGWFQSARMQLLDFDVAIHSDHRAVISDRRALRAVGSPRFRTECADDRRDDLPG